MSVGGLDVSHWNGDIDWRAVARSGRHFAIPAMGDGLTYTDPTWTRERHGEIVGNGLVCFPYFWLEPDENPREQAARAVELARSRGWAMHRGGWRHDLDGPIMVDVETASRHSDAHLQWACDEFGRWVHYETKRGVIFYSYGGFVREHNLRPPAESGAYLHAEYGTNRPHVPRGFSALGWQWTQTGWCPGVSGYVDLDVLFMSLQRLHQWVR